MSVIVRFTIDGTDVDFEDGEVFDTTVENTKDFSIQENQNHNPIAFIDGDSYQIISMTFSEFKNDTIDRINQLVDAKESMICYYQYSNDPTDSITVIYYPEGRVKKQTRESGYDSYSREHVLRFLQIS